MDMNGYEKLTIKEVVDSEGNIATFQPGDRVYVMPNKMYATVLKQQMCYDGVELWFWGNVELIYDDGVKGTSNSWQLEKQ